MKSIAFVFVYTLFLFADGNPHINDKIIEYVDQNIGQQVGRGECWDLAAEALAYANAYLDRRTQKNIYDFGDVVKPGKDKIYPGDIIQFENIELEYQKGNAIYKESMPHHTAIVYKVISENEFVLAHQNTSFSGRKVGLSNLNIKNIKKGKYIFYRPISM